MAPRTVGLPIHLLYPILSAILLGVAAFPTAGSVWYVSAQTNVLAVSPLAPDCLDTHIRNLHTSGAFRISGLVSFDLPPSQPSEELS